MRVIAKSTLRAFWSRHAGAQKGLEEWYDACEKANWKSPNELKNQFPDASVINAKRTVFNINGNRYRLIVDIEYGLRFVFITWFGTHAEYDRIDAASVYFTSTHSK